MSVLPYLENTDEGLREIVKVAASGPVIREVKFTPKHLHAQERENDDEEEKEEEQGGDGAHRVEERSHKIAQRGPVPAKQFNVVK